MQTWLVEVTPSTLYEIRINNFTVNAITKQRARALARLVLQAHYSVTEAKKLMFDVTPYNNEK